MANLPKRKKIEIFIAYRGNIKDNNGLKVLRLS